MLASAYSPQTKHLDTQQVAELYTGVIQKKKKIQFGDPRNHDPRTTNRMVVRCV